MSFSEVKDYAVLQSLPVVMRKVMDRQAKLAEESGNPFLPAPLINMMINQCKKLTALYGPGDIIDFNKVTEEFITLLLDKHFNSIDDDIEGLDDPGRLARDQFINSIDSLEKVSENIFTLSISISKEMADKFNKAYGK